MSRIPRETVDAVREATDIVEVVQRHVALKKRGKDWLGLCPFHQEKSPSFNVIPQKQMFHCFGCQVGGDVFKFLILLEGLSFFEAVKELGTAVGIEVEDRELTPAEKRAMRQKATAYDVLEAACATYEGWLWTGPQGQVARDYLLNTRAMTPDAARQARLGYAPGGWTRLLDHLHGLGYDAEQLEQVGLAKRSERGSAFDLLRERLIIPIRDERGRVVAFGGRILQSGSDAPKYINTPETPLYKKSSVLYGIEKARVASGRAKRMIVVEGYFDVLSMHRAGFEEAVATCGTSLTAQHLEKIRLLTREVLMIMDADKAGLDAAERTLPMFVEAGVQAWRVELPGGAKDPDELVRNEGPARMEQVLQEHREPLFEWVVKRRVEAAGSSAMGRERALEQVLPLLHRLRDPTLTSRVAVRLGIAEEVVLERIRGWTPPKEPSPAGPEVLDAQPTVPSAPEFVPTREVSHLLWLIVHRYEQVADVLSRVDPRALPLDPLVVPVLARLLTGEPVAGLVGDLSDPSLARTVQAVVARAELYAEEQAVEALLDLMGRLVKPGWSAELAAAKDGYERAARGADVAASMQLLREVKRLQERERSFTAALKARDVDRCVSWLGPATAA